MSNNDLFLGASFVKELDEAASPGHLDQIELFYDEPEELFNSLSEIITSSQIAVTYALANPGSAPVAKKNEPAGHLLLWPEPQSGLVTIIHSEQGGSCNSFSAAFPFISDGIMVKCRLQKVRLFASRLEAQLEVLAGSDELLCLTFYDAHYLGNRFLYMQNEAFNFILRGFAYHLQINDDSDGLSALFQREELGADHYEIHGPVTTISEPAGRMLGQKTWLIRVAIARTVDDEAVEMEFCLTQKTLGKNSLPQRGQNVSAVIWLQGHLWGPTAE
jgi:hypothetical protein